MESCYKFAVVVFSKGRTVHIVSETWLRGKFCWWPTKYMTNQDVEQAIRMHESPNLRKNGPWSKYLVKHCQVCDTFEEAENQLIEVILALNTNIEDDSANNPLDQFYIPECFEPVRCLSQDTSYAEQWEVRKNFRTRSRGLKIPGFMQPTFTQLSAIEQRIEETHQVVMAMLQFLKGFE